MKILIEKYKIYIYFVFLSLAFVSGKWIFSYLAFPSENIINKLLFEVYDFQYFPLIHSLSNLNLSPSYSLMEETLKLIPMPYASLLFHSIFLKIFGYFGFILLEFLCVGIFLYIFFLIFKKINFSNITSFLLSCMYKSFYLIFSLNIFLITIESINRAKNPINGIYISEDNNKSTKLGTFSLLRLSSLTQ